MDRSLKVTWWFGLYHVPHILTMNYINLSVWAGTVMSDSKKENEPHNDELEQKVKKNRNSALKLWNMCVRYMGDFSSRWLGSKPCSENSLLSDLTERRREGEWVFFLNCIMNERERKRKWGWLNKIKVLFCNISCSYYQSLKDIRHLSWCKECRTHHIVALQVSMDTAYGFRF